LIPQTATKIEEGDLTVDSTAKAQSIARNFSKYLNTKKTSRILLNRFVSLVA
jgi:predicted component of type VI protein secretion system